MDGRIFLGVALLACIALTSAQKKEYISYGDVTARIFGFKGKVSLYDFAGTENDLPESKEKITFQVKTVCELAADKSKVGNTGRVKHCMESFKSDDFAVMNITDSKIPNSNISALFLEGGGSLGDMSSKITYYIYIAKEDGSITDGGETIQVTSGQIKISLKYNSWTWCGCKAVGDTGCEECKKGQDNQTGMYVSTVFTMKVPGNTAEKQTTAAATGDMYNFGDGTSMVLSKVVVVDGTPKPLSDQDLKLETKGAFQELTLVIPRFASDAIYDPTYVVDDKRTSAAGRSTGSFLTLLSLLIFFFIRY